MKYYIMKKEVGIVKYFAFYFIHLFSHRDVIISYENKKRERILFDNKSYEELSKKLFEIINKEKNNLSLRD